MKRGWVGAVVLCISLMSSVCQAKSVFAVSGHETGIVKAYLIDPSGAISFQVNIPNPLSDATGLCLWPQKDRMFVTYEGSGKISWAGIKNLNRDPDHDNYTLALSGGNGLGGMAIDESTSRLYVLNRGTNRVYAFDYDEAANTLVPIALSGTTTYRTLPEVGSHSGFDIAIDPQGSMLMELMPVSRLYVSDNTGDVEYYNLATWEHEGTLTFEQSVIGLGLDTTRGFLYGGNFSGGGGNSYLMRMPLNGDLNDYVEKNMGYSVMDISVDDETGYLYLTSYRSYNGYDGAVEVYDPTNWTDGDPNLLIEIDVENDSDFGGSNNGPAGIAVGPTYKPPHDMFLNKVDDVEDPDGYVVPNDIYHYEIAFHPGAADEPNVVITDVLPEGVDFVSADPNWGVYLPRPEHKVVWELGDVPGYDPNAPGDPNYYFELTVQVNTHAEPMGTLYNKVTAESDWSYVDADETTRVGCWGGDIIYTDWNSPGPTIGTTWATAYHDLNRALTRAASGCGSQIHVADGAYHPGTQTGDSFTIPDEIPVYGGYAGYGAADPNEHNWKRYKTVLSGYISENDYGVVTRNNTVVKAGNNCILDGLTVEEGRDYGIFGSGNSYSVINSIVTNNEEIGIYCLNGDLTIEWSDICENGYQGIWHRGSGYLLTTKNCKIHDNQYDGIWVEFSTSQIMNSLIYQNGSSDNYYGIRLDNLSSSPTIRNNTIVHNVNEGIRRSGGSTPIILNNILYYNNVQETNSPQLAGIDSFSCCCIYDPNSQSSTPDGNGNITCEPDFVYDSAPYGFYHIKYESSCRNAGSNTGVGIDETDFDGEPRIADDGISIVDIGADEVDCEDTWNEDDWTFDGVINFGDFTFLSRSWLSRDPNDPSIITDPNFSSDPDYADPQTLAQWEQVWFPWGKTSDLNSDLTIDLADLETFCENWLWQACWRENYMAMYSMMGGSGGDMFMEMPPMVTFSTETMYTEPIQTVIPADTGIQSDIEQDVENIAQILDFLYTLLEEDDPDNEDTILEMIAVLEDWLEKIDLE